jgi:hypothetical protein
MATSSRGCLSAALTFFAASDQFHHEVFRQIRRPKNYFRMVMTNQPLTQLTLGLFPGTGTEFRTSLQPPMRNAPKANELVVME